MAQDIPALILAGGLGTRLRDVLTDRPKALAPVAGRPFIYYLLDQLEEAGTRLVIVCTGYRANQSQEALGPRYGRMTVRYSEEPTPLGTGGALRLALPLILGDQALVLNGDSYVDVPLVEFVAGHQASGFPGSLLLTWVEDASRFGTVETDAAGRLLAFREKQGLAQPGWINAGIYLLARQLIEDLPAEQPVSLERDAFPRWLANGLGGYARRAPFLDVGTPESFARAEEFLTRVRPVS
jgi:NDP-sugar pyrophosphorylase family protein